MAALVAADDAAARRASGGPVKPGAADPSTAAPVRHQPPRHAAKVMHDDDSDDGRDGAAGRSRGRGVVSSPRVTPAAAHTTGAKPRSASAGGPGAAAAAAAGSGSGGPVMSDATASAAAAAASAAASKRSRSRKPAAGAQRSRSSQAVGKRRNRSGKGGDGAGAGDAAIRFAPVEITYDQLPMVSVAELEQQAAALRLRVEMSGRGVLAPRQNEPEKAKTHWDFLLAEMARQSCSRGRARAVWLLVVVAMSAALLLVYHAASVTLMGCLSACLWRLVSTEVARARLQGGEGAKDEAEEEAGQAHPELL